MLDTSQAAELLRRSADHARERLMVNQPLIYGAWGLAWLIGCGAMWLDWVMFCLGAWELVVAAAGAWTGPAGVLFMDAVAGGGGFLAAAALLAWRNRS